MRDHFAQTLSETKMFKICMPFLLLPNLIRIERIVHSIIFSALSSDGFPSGLIFFLILFKDCIFIINIYRNALLSRSILRTTDTCSMWFMVTMPILKNSPNDFECLFFSFSLFLKTRSSQIWTSTVSFLLWRVEQRLVAEHLV